VDDNPKPFCFACTCAVYEKDREIMNKAMDELKSTVKMLKDESDKKKQRRRPEKAAFVGQLRSSDVSV
jgi:hypothetical protein